MRNVADADSVRRQNRGLVLSALRRGGPMSRSQLAVTTGLSNASITAIGSELIAQAILEDGDAAFLRLEDVDEHFFLHLSSLLREEEGGMRGRSPTHQGLPPLAIDAGPFRAKTGQW